MRNLICNDELYKRILIDEKNNQLIKISSITTHGWNLLSKKNLPFLNKPTKWIELTAEERKKYQEYYSKIYIPYLYGYKTLYNVSKDELSTKQTLLLLRKILYSIQIMHNNNFYHGDIFSRNIMINNDLDFSIVDLDSAIIDDIVSEENTYYYDDMTIEQSIDRTIFDDKIDTLKMFLGFLAHGTFNECISLPIDINILNLPPIIYDEIKYCLSRKIIDQDYYFLDIIDELLSIGYESKILTK